MSRTWSKYQTAIFAHIEAPKSGNLIVEAVAGSGKTTTLVEAIKRAVGSSIFLAFNKSIATELASRGVNARTFHSLTYSPVLRARKANTVTNDKLRKLTKANMSGDAEYLYGAFVCKLVGLARQVGIGTALCADTVEAWYDIVEHHNLELDSEDANMTDAVDYARKLLTWSNESNMVDFDDMLYFAVKDGISLPKFDNVYVDEAQDTNAIQRALLRKIMKPTSRLVAVGDPAQAIYGFRGADSSSLDMIAQEFNCSRLPLSVSYRCAKSVVEYARNWVGHIEAAEGAPEGQVEQRNEWNVSQFIVGDLVVCRTTKPLVALGYKMLKSRIPVRIMGQEIGKGLQTLIKKMRAKGIDQLVSKLAVWADREAEIAIAADKPGKAESIRDKQECILTLIDGLDEINRTIPELLRVIDQLFADQVNVTTLATIHKAKGLEADRVYWLNRSACPSKWARKPWQLQQEFNLCYVAATRAKLHLVLIEEPA